MSGIIKIPGTGRRRDHEDRCTVFGEELLKWLGVKEPVKGIAPTELIHLETRKMYQDFNYVMRNGWWYHIEFESDPLTKADLRRFREYEAATSRTYGVEVLTCVICTANRKHILTEITEGINTYRVKLIQMKKKDGDKILRKIQKKKKLKIGRASCRERV